MVSVFLGGCDSLRGTPKQQGAVIGAVGGGAAGAAIHKQDRVLGAIIGGAVGAAGGYAIGGNKDKIEEALRSSEESPATPDDVANSITGDLNNDGFVTMDEVVALEKADLTDDQIISRLEATGHIFDLTAEQEQYLTDNGVSSRVVARLPKLNAQARNALSVAP